jgi:hypothetical protein
MCRLVRARGLVWSAVAVAAGLSSLLVCHPRRNMLTTIIVILVILWLLGFFGPRYSTRIPNTGGAVHTLIVIAVILIILKLLGII